MLIEIGIANRQQRERPGGVGDLADQIQLADVRFRQVDRGQHGAGDERRDPRPERDDVQIARRHEAPGR